MKIKKVIIKNFKCIQDLTLNFEDHLNILVANNDMGKSSILEAIHLALTKQLNGKYVDINTLNPFLFNRLSVDKYIASLSTDKKLQPPEIMIEVYFKDEPSVAHMEGSNNSLRQKAAGIYFKIEYDQKFNSSYEDYIKHPETILHTPIEFYKLIWSEFSDTPLQKTIDVPVKSILIDASDIKNNEGTKKYIIDLLSDYLNETERISLSQSYRRLKEQFLTDQHLIKLNDVITANKDEITQKNLSFALDSSSKSKWENSIEPHLEKIPLVFAGKGEQSSVKIKLAMKASSEKNIFLIEEPENHLSFSNLNILIKNISDKSTDKQLIITTHSSFVLNKLGVKNVILFKDHQTHIKLTNLTKSTLEYFQKLPSHDTLRVILSKKVILVEGPSDELVVQRAYKDKHGMLPIENGVDVISVRSLAFKRFLEISKLLSIPTDFITDNDGKSAEKQKNFASYITPNINLRMNTDNKLPSLEQCIISVNSLTDMNTVLGTKFTKEELLDYMKNNKTEWALKIFDSDSKINYPQYIIDAIR